MDFAGHPGRKVRQQVERSATQFIERYAASERRVLLLESKHCARVADSGARERADRPGRDGVDADALAPEIDRQIPHGRLERRLGEAHDVVVRHGPFAAVEGQRQHRATVAHQPRGTLGALGERKARDHHRAAEIVARSLGVAALQLVLVGETDGMDVEIERTPLLLDFAEHRIDGRDVLDIARQDQLRSEQLGERLHAPAERLALIGKRERRAMRRKRLRDPPGDRVVVCDPHDQPALALHQGGHGGSLQMRLNGCVRLIGGHDRHDLALHQVAPVEQPFLQEAGVVAFH